MFKEILSAANQYYLNCLKLATKKKTAIIVKGNPKYIKSTIAKEFYNDIKQYLKQLGFVVKFDDGAPNTTPPKADLWIGHSRGVDRLSYAYGEPGYENIKMVGLGASGKEKFKIINHHKDNLKMPPNDYHFLFTDKMRKEIKKIINEV